MHLKVALPIVAFAAYVGIVVSGAQSAGFWRVSLAKDTVLWFLFVGIAMLVNAGRVADPDFVRRTVVSAVGVTALLEFYMNDLVVFSFPAELVLQFVLAFLVVTSVLGERSAESRSAKAWSDILLALVGVGMLLAVALELLRAWDALDRVETLLSLALPAWLTVLAIPFIYLFSLAMNYELAFMRIAHATEDRRARRRANIALLLGLHLQNSAVSGLAADWPRRLAAADSLTAARRTVALYRAERTRKRAAARLRRANMIRFAGVKSTDANGEPLDRRELDETREALRWLSTCHMGWYNRERRYRPEVLEFWGGGSLEGLPKEHGVQMSIRADGQAWFAWRRTVGGWCVAVGAGGPPPSQSECEGPEPPTSYPGTDVAWSRRPSRS